MRSVMLAGISSIWLVWAGTAHLPAAQGNQAVTKRNTATSKTVAVKSAGGSIGTPSVSYREVIEPFLKANCGSCHSTDKHNGGFVIETPDSLRKGGTRFGEKVIVPGKAAESALIGYLRGTKQPRMPLSGKPVAEPQIKQIETWINQGAKIDAVKLRFPYAPVAVSAIPPVKKAAWCRNPVDNFVLAKLEAKGLSPAPPASKVALLRRVYVDLVGVPPSPHETEAFLRDPSPNAYDKVVDRLLADSRYGERWGRHWLDLVRYADTHGFENDGIRPRAWRFRDYVIKAFNEDKPYNRFIKEQIAGEELYPDDADALVATGFARLGPWDEISREPDQRWQDYLNDVTDTTGFVFLGMTVGCARCHDHKYDRISQNDYYRMQAFFVGTQWVEKQLPDSAIPADVRAKLNTAHTQIESLRSERKSLLDRYRETAQAEKQKRVKPGEKVTLDEGDIVRVMPQKDHENFDRLSNDMRRLEEEVAPIEPLAEMITEGGKSAPVAHLLLRGNLHTPGPEVQPGFVAALCNGRSAEAKITQPSNGHTTGRRAALAEWLASKDNPLPARVLVNRVWQQHFGRGIIATPSDFGINGEKPTHPELLDWLAGNFIAETAGGKTPAACNWSLKKLHRLMLLSNTYQQATQHNPAAAKVDPGNTLLWRMNRVRLDGEALRDSILTVSGRLNPQQGGPGIYPKVSEEVLATGSTHKWGSSPEDQGLRRTIYVFQRRSLVLPIIEAFDGADMSNTCPRRAVTTIAPQALALFNGEFTHGESRFFAERVAKEAGSDRGRQIETAYRIALSRPPTAAQKATALAFLARKAQLHTTEKQTPQDADKTALADFCHVLINTNEFIYLD